MIFPNLTVKDNLRIGGFPAENKGHTLTSGYEKVFDYFPQLHGLQEVLATNLSGGQQQMLAIAQALMGRPDLLMLDEPSLGLAPVFVDTIFAIIKRISKEEKCAILLVEQNVLRTLSVSDYVYVVSSGSIISQAPAAEYIKDNSIIKRNLGFFL